MPFEEVFIAVSVLISLSFVVTIVVMLSPKLRGKLMSKQFKATKYMMEDSKKDLEDLGSTAIYMKKNIIDKNEDTLKEMADKTVDIYSDSITNTAKAIKKGLKSSKYCKYCGSEVDNDSNYCSKCGKKLN